MESPTYPRILKSYHDIKAPNEQEMIHSGDFILKGTHDGSAIEISVNGSIYYTWIPRRGVTFDGTISSITGSRNHVIEAKFDTFVNGVCIGEAHVRSFSIGNETSSTISGILRDIFIGDKTIPVDSIAFGVPNFDEFLGDSVEYEKKDGGKWIGRNRIHLEDDTFSIIIDKKRNYKQLNESLIGTGGYIFLYDGCITKKSGESITYDEVSSHDGIRGALYYFLTFLNGQRTAPCYIKGIHNGEEKWTDYVNYLITPNSPNAYQWLSSNTIVRGLDELWKNFFTLWKSDRDFLEFSIHWLTESLDSETYIESKITHIQNALELIFNWYVVEQRKMIIGRDSENISAANKIRMLISQLGIDNTVPEILTNLKAFVADSNDIADGPDTIVQIRNAIVHANEAKRKKLQNIEPIVKIEALMLAIEYVILSILRILKYNQKYVCAYDLKLKSPPWINCDNLNDIM